MSIFSRTSLIIIAIAIPDHSGGAKLNLLKLNHLAAPPVQTRPTYAPPDYAPPVYHHAAAYPTPTYFPPTVPRYHSTSCCRPRSASHLLADTPADNLPAYSQAYEPPADDQAHEQPAYEQAHRLPVYNHAYRPPVDTAPLVENPVSDLPNPLTTPTETPSNPPAEETAADTLENGLAFDGHGKPSPLPHTMDRRNAPRVSLTVNMITGVGPAPSTSSAPTTTPHIAPGIKVDNSQAALSPHGNPEATTPSGGELTPPASSYKGVSKVPTSLLASPGTRPLSSFPYSVSCLAWFSPATQCASHISRPTMLIITRPDGSEISPLSSGRSGFAIPAPFRGHGISPPPLPMPAFAPPPAPAGPLSMSFMKLLSPTANLAQQNLAESRASTTSETMSQRPASDDENLEDSAPGSVVWSARSSSATGKLTSGLSGEEGYWESVNMSGSESVGRMGCRSSRGRSVAMSVM
ncbi:hypothetical protein BJV77DRAFT_1045072, partial [Russula vinacea]